MVEKSGRVLVLLIAVCVMVAVACVGCVLVMMWKGGANVSVSSGSGALETELVRLRAENSELKVEIGRLQAKLDEAENSLVAASAHLVGNIKAGNELLDILKKFNGMPTASQRSSLKAQLRSFLGEYNDQTVVLRGRVRQVKDSLLKDKRSVFLDVFEGVTIRFDAEQDQMRALNLLNTGYEAVIQGRVQGGIFNRFLDSFDPCQSITMVFVRVVDGDEYGRAMKWVEQSGKESGGR